MPPMGACPGAAPMPTPGAGVGAGAACGTAAIGIVGGNACPPGPTGAAPPDIGATPTIVPFSLLGTADCAPAARGTPGTPAPGTEAAGTCADGGGAAGAGAGAGACGPTPGGAPGIR